MKGELLFLDQEKPRSGIENMRIDRELLAAVEELERPVTWVRFYRWETPTVSLGKHQEPERAVDLRVCTARGIAIVHRPTGGRAVLHQDEVTYAVVSNAADLFSGGGIRQTYKSLAGGLQCGLKHLGLESKLASESRTMKSSEGFTPPCFASAARFELTWKNRKLAGSAQRRGKRAFLQHGSLPLTLDYSLMSSVFRTSVESLQSSICSLSEALGWRPSYAEIRDALQRGFEETLEMDPTRVVKKLPREFQEGFLGKSCGGRYGIV